MSNGRHSFASRNWTDQDFPPAYLANNISTQDRVYPRSFSLRDHPIIHRGMPPWHLHQEREATRVPVTSFGRFHVDQEPYLPFRMLVLDNIMEREATHRPPQAISTYSPREYHEDSRLTQDEQRTALAKLKKSVYNPTLKKLSKRLSLYYRDHNRSDNYSERKNHDDHDDDGGEKCAICLEDFEAKEMVMVTPCKHMFHEDCIVPWVKGQGRCPVCRFLFCEPTRSRNSLTMNTNGTSTANLAANDNVSLIDLISIVTALEHDLFFADLVR